VLVEPATGHDVKLATDHDDQAPAAALGRKPEFRHLHLRITGPSEATSASS
jgi:hypothetical protein